MKQHLWAKVIAGLLGLGLLLWGISVMDADPTLRVTQTVRMADIEAGRLPRVGQLVRIDDAWLMPTWVTEHSHSRKGGDHAHVTVGLGSRDTLERAIRRERVDVALWMRLREDFHTPQAASAAMNQNALYEHLKPHEGVVAEIRSSVRENLRSDGVWQSTATLQLDEGNTPSTQGDGVGLLAAGLVLLLATAAWLALDRAHAAWRAALATPQHAVFAGTSPWLLLAALAVPVAALLAYLAASAWVDSRLHEWALISTATALLAAAGWALWRNRVALVVTDDGLDRAGPGGTKPLVRWADVQALSLSVQKFRGTTRATYRLHTAGQDVKVGNGMFTGGVTDHEGLGKLMRQIVMQRVAPGLMETLARGELLSFGGVGVRREGLVKGGKAQGELLPWAELESAPLKNGQLKIKKQGKLLAWDTVALAKLRNPDLLLALIAQRGQPSA